MRSNAKPRKNSGPGWLTSMLVAGAMTVMAASANAQLSGNLRYVTGYDLVPNPPSPSVATTLTLHGFFPTGCGTVEEASVIDPAHVVIRLQSSEECDTTKGWSGSFPLGFLPYGHHTVTIAMTIDRPDSGVMVYEGALTFGVPDTTIDPPPPPPSSAPPLLASTDTDPYPPTPDVPMALILSGYAPFDCPIVSDAAVIDTSHLAITLSSGPACSDTARYWTHRFELGLQREGHHFMDLAVTLDAGDSLAPHHVQVRFLVVNDTTGWDPPPPDSLENVLSVSRPNPFVTESRFSVSLETAADVDVSVFDVNGRRVSRVFRGQLAPGTTELAWNGRRDDGTRVPAGVYFYRLETQGRVISRRLILRQ
jgi:FlgD Ig-like domain